MVLYVIKAALGMAIILGFYRLLLKEERFFSSNRAYLLGGLLFTFCLPFMVLPALFSDQGILSVALSEVGAAEPYVIQGDIGDGPKSEAVDAALATIPIPEATATGTKFQRPLFWIGLVYLFGMGLLCIKFCYQLWCVFKSIGDGADKFHDGRYVIINNEMPSGPCSFFHYIFIDAEKYDDVAYAHILAHEKVHARNYHSFDLLMAEVVCMLLWFSPFTWMFRKDIEKNIEFQTDHFMLRTELVDPEDYQMNLLRTATGQKSLSIVSNYNKSLIKKRIIMMNTKQSKRTNYFKYALIAPMLCFTILFMNRPSMLYAQESTGPSEYYDGDTGEQTPLMRAAADGELQTVRRLISEGADANQMIRGEGTALYLALQHSHVGIANVLLAHGADPNLGNRMDGFPLLVAIASGDEDMVRRMIEKGADVNKLLPGDGSALIVASKLGYLGIVKMLVKEGANLDMGVKGDGNPLIMASKNGQLHVVKYLIGEGADVNAAVKDDETPLINASEQGHLAVVRYLVEQGADVNLSSTDSSGRYRSPLKMARLKGHTEISTFLKSKGAEE